VGKNGHVWGVNSAGGIYFRTGITNDNLFGSDWQRIEGVLTQISCGPLGAVWGVNSNGNLYCRTEISPEVPQGKDWRPVEGSAVKIAVGPPIVWVITSSEDIYYREGISDMNPTGSSWVKVGGKLVQLHVNATGDVWGVHPKGEIYTRSGKNGNWAKVDGALACVSSGFITRQATQCVWGVTGNGEIYSRLGGSTGAWKKMNGTLKQIDSCGYHHH